jgi:hypothetical protein
MAPEWLLTTGISTELRKWALMPLLLRMCFPQMEVEPDPGIFDKDFVLSPCIQNVIEL